MALTDMMVRSAKPEEKAYKLTDGNGLFLLVQPNGSKYWRLRYRSDGKEKMLALGLYPEVSLSEVRQKRDEARKLIAAGIDPNEHKKEVKIQQHHAEQTFEAVARAWHADNKKWSDAHAARILKSLSDNIFSAIGSTHISELKTRDLLAPIKRVERSGRVEVAKRLKQRVCVIMTYAVQNGLIDYNPAHDMAGAIMPAKVEHRPALELERLPELLGRIDRYKGREFTKWVINLSLLLLSAPVNCALPAGLKSTSNALCGLSRQSVTDPRCEIL